MPSKTPARGLRMQDELYLKLKAIAEREDRSYNQQAVNILKKYVEDYEKQNGEIDVDTDKLYK